MPYIWKNRITQSGFNGILCTGESCQSDIRGNVIDTSRKAGIKICELATAHIGGTTKEDLHLFMKQLPLPQVSNLPEMINPLGVSQSFSNTVGGETKKAGLSLGDASKAALASIKFGTSTKSAKTSGLGRDQTTQEVRENPHIPKMNVKSFYNSNTISLNLNQGILIVEGSSATIIANRIDKNIKANIAMGGLNCGLTKVMYNLIESSKSEGIFVIEGEENLLLQENEVVGNHDGIVLVESLGIVRGNVVKENQRSGILTANKTFCLLEGNIIEENWTAGILIKDPSLPEMRKNEVSKNYYQVQMEAHAKPKWDHYLRENPKIIGANEIPKATCAIF